MKKNILFFMLIMFMHMTIVQPMGTAVLQKNTDNNVQKKNMRRNVIIVLGVITIGTMGGYLIKQLLQQSASQVDEEKIGNHVINKLKLQETSYQSYDPSKYELKCDAKINPSATQALKNAIFANDFAKMKKAIQDGALNHPDVDELWLDINSANTAYYFMENYPRDKKMLLNKKNVVGEIRILEVVSQNRNPALAEALIMLGSDVNIIDHVTKRPLLTYASCNGDAKTFILLVKYGAFMDQKDDCGNTCWLFVNEKFMKDIHDHTLTYPDTVATIEQAYQLYHSQSKK